MDNSSFYQKKYKNSSMYVSAEVRNKMLKVKELLENSKEEITPSQVVEEALNEALDEAEKLLDRMRKLIEEVDCFINTNRSFML